jgi:hypothetical protein
MWFRGKTKSFNENLAPLRRFLERRIGRPWNAVWSELREFLSPKSAVQKHVFDHVVQFVERNPVMIDGSPHRPEACGSHRDSYWPLSTYGLHGFYVCPRTGILRLARQDHERKAKPSASKTK